MWAGMGCSIHADDRVGARPDAHEVVSTLVKDTLFAYGEVGIYDPERLAEIDFLNHPEELVELV